MKITQAPLNAEKMHRHIRHRLSKPNLHTGFEYLGFSLLLTNGCQKSF